MARKWKPLPSRDTLLKWLKYDPEKGELSRPYKRAKFGNLVYSKKSKDTGKEYPWLRVEGEEFQVLRVLWKILSGEDPDGMVEVRDGNRWNWKAENLILKDLPPSGVSKSSHLRKVYGEIFDFLLS